MTHPSKPTSPVLFIIFNRPDTTFEVFNQIRKYKPSKLFIASDGPRAQKNGEKNIIESMRKKLLSLVDWDCKVKTLFRKENLGCKYAVSGAIDWFFDHVESGIILEDDCVPSLSFFRFSEEMLELYKDDERIMQVSGLNLEESSTVDNSYFFSDFFSAWGWATWRRAWKKYDVKMRQYKNIMDDYGLLKNIIRERNFKKTRKIYDLTFNGKIDTWDYQWIFCCDINSALCIVPHKNMIRNIGFQANATHTRTHNPRLNKLKVFNVAFPLKHEELIINRKEYKLSCEKVLKKTLFEKIISYLGV